LQRGEMEVIALRKRSRFRNPRAIRLIRWIRGFIDAAASLGQSITTASRNAVNLEPDAAYGVVARAGPPPRGAHGSRPTRRAGPRRATAAVILRPAPPRRTIGTGDTTRNRGISNGGLNSPAGMADEWGVATARVEPHRRDLQLQAIHPPLLWASNSDSGFPLWKVPAAPPRQHLNRASGS
jgi:hypothetical protein